MTQVNLNNCDIEPIHIPGAIQSHGVFLAVNDLFEVMYCSENVSSFFKIPVADVLGKAIADIPFLNNLRGVSFEMMLRFANEPGNTHKSKAYQKSLSGQVYNIVVTMHGDYHLVDIEPIASGLSSDLQSMIGRSLSEILSDKDLSILLSNAASQIKELIAYDRVMIYKFHEDGHGEVVAEEKNAALESWMGLHYPASDIPKQARELYKINLVRLIADANSVPSALVSMPVEGISIPLDLTHSSLRAVSPMHIQYLKNMGVASSFSVSIVYNDTLWGLIACHNYTPKFINFDERESAKLIGQIVSSAIGFREKEEEQWQLDKQRNATDTITRYLTRNAPVEEALFNEEAKLDKVISCGGAALYYGNTLEVAGNVPGAEFIEELINWLDEQINETGYYMTDHLSADYPKASHYCDVASGLLACRLGKDLKEYMLWFRPEIITTVRWAGNPIKQERVDENGMRFISPRESFAEWSENVKCKSASWKHLELKAILTLRDEVNYAINRKALELRAIHEKLRQAYADLDAFSYTIAHDLKNPLTTIKSYAQLIEKGTMNADKVSAIATRINLSADKMKGMIDEVLAYSKVGQSKVNGKAIDMQQMIAEIRSDLMIASKHPDLIIEVHNTPQLYGDQTMIYQVFSNIIGNAVKYSARSNPSIVKINGSEENDKVKYSVSDNGIGIPEKYLSKIFDLFTRTAESEDFEGTGVGLAITKRIVDKHRGEIDVVSVAGEGSTFQVIFDMV